MSYKFASVARNEISSTVHVLYTLASNICIHMSKGTSSLLSSSHEIPGNEVGRKPDWLLARTLFSFKKTSSCLVIIFLNTIQLHLVQHIATFCISIISPIYHQISYRFIAIFQSSGNIPVFKDKLNMWCKDSNWYSTSCSLHDRVLLKFCWFVFFHIGNDTILLLFWNCFKAKWINHCNYVVYHCGEFLLQVFGPISKKHLSKSLSIFYQQLLFSY
jgi:hypothetical protein